MSEKKLNTSLIVPGQRKRVLKFNSLNLNSFSRASNKPDKIETSLGKRKKSDIEVAEILLDMRSESNSGESSESEALPVKKTVKKIKPTTPKKTPKKKKDDVAREPEQVPEKEHIEQPTVPPPPEIKTRLIIVFNSAVDTAYLLEICRRIPELQSQTDEQILKLVNSASEKYKDEPPIHLGSEIYVAAQIFRYLVETSMVLSFNLKNRTKRMFASDTKKAFACLKYVETKLLTTHSRDVNDDWESCLNQAVQLLGLNESDRIFMHPIVSEAIHQKFLQGKHVKVYVAATLSAVLTKYSSHISQSYPFDKVWQALYSRFGITRLTLYSAMQTILESTDSMTSTSGLVVTTLVDPGSMTDE